MKYIADIYHGHERLPYIVSVQPKEFSCKVKDTDVSGSKIYDGTALGDWVVGCSVYGSSLFVAKNTTKTVRIFKYLEEAAMTMSPPPESRVDRVAWTNMATKLWEHGNKVLVIDTVSDIIRVSNGVVLRKNGLQGDGWTAYNLYDFIGLLCRQANVFVMRYHTVYIKNSYFPDSMLLKFRHDARAQTFFTKMYMDVMNR